MKSQEICHPIYIYIYISTRGMTYKVTYVLRFTNRRDHGIERNNNEIRNNENLAKFAVSSAWKACELFIFQRLIRHGNDCFIARISECPKKCFSDSTIMQPLELGLFLFRPSCSLLSLGFFCFEVASLNSSSRN